SSAMTDFVDWKNSRGLSTELVDLSEVGSTADDISNYIENYYNNEGLTYVLLVGDNDRVPTPIVNVGGVDPGNHASDPSYSFIEGDDYYPEILVGRFSGSDISHIETQVERSVSYEQNPDGEWREKAIGLASDEGPGYNDLMDYEHMDILRDRLLDYEYTHVDRFYDSGYGDLAGSPNSGHVSDAVEDGRHLINYVGHGMTTYIATSGFDTGDMAALTNDKLPFFITVACLTGEHDASTDPCFGEQWTRVTHNGEPAGGIAAFSCSKSQAWAEPMSAQDEMMHLYTETYDNNVKITTAGIAFNGCMHMNDQYGSSGYYETATWTIFGDPSAVITGEEFGQGTPPEVTVTSPNGGESFTAGTEESITWSTTAGDDPVDYVDLFYSVDTGASWDTIDSNVDDTGSYTWTVPNEDSSDCLVRVEAVDTAGRSGSDESDSTFTITGTPPASPQNLDVQHTGGDTTILFQDDVSTDKGYTTEVSGSASGSEWAIRSNGASVGSNSWDFGDGQYYKSSGEPYVSRLTSPAIEIPAEANAAELSFDNWRDFGMQTTYLDGGNLKLSTNGVNGDYSLITPNEGYDGEINGDYGNPLGGQQAWGGTVDWETVTFDLSAYAGETIHLRWEAGVEDYDEDYGEGWRIDDITVTAEGVPSEGDESNLLTWDASPDDHDEVSHYNIYRSADQNGPWDENALIDSVSGDGSAQYQYVDPDRGAVDDTYWWYVVRAEGTNGLEEGNEDTVQEPDGITTFEISLAADTQTNDWNFVSFNLIPEDTSLTAILDDAEYGISGSYDKVMYYDSTTEEWISYIPGRAEHFNDLNGWDSTMGVWIQMSADDTLTIEGTEPTSTDITLEPGWNMVGLPSSTAGNHGLPQEVSIVGYFDASQENNLRYDYNPDNFEFGPGEGYYMYNDADYDVTWTVEY
ncbi:MAG: C25 family cysteine peptidase, partial [Candidatus Saliniplasma sp.]